MKLNQIESKHFQSSFQFNSKLFQVDQEKLLTFSIELLSKFLINYLIFETKTLSRSNHPLEISARTRLSFFSSCVVKKSRQANFYPTERRATRRRFRFLAHFHNFISLRTTYNGKSIKVALMQTACDWKQFTPRRARRTFTASGAFRTLSTSFLCETIFIC